MTYQQAKKLHSQDEVILKYNNVVVKVVEVWDIPEEKAVRIVINDGRTFWNYEIK